jgi:predicted kinase
MERVVILSGISGAGKSHYAVKLTRDTPDSTIVSADRFFYRDNGEYEFDVTKLSEAHATCFRYFIDALMIGDELVVVDNTNTTIWEISPYVLGAQAFGYDFEIVTIHCPLDLACDKMEEKARAWAKTRGGGYVSLPLCCSPRRQTDGSLMFWINTGRTDNLTGWKTQQDIEAYLKSDGRIIETK